MAAAAEAVLVRVVSERPLPRRLFAVAVPAPRAEIGGVPGLRTGGRNDGLGVLVPLRVDKVALVIVAAPFAAIERISALRAGGRDDGLGVVVSERGEDLLALAFSAAGTALRPKAVRGAGRLRLLREEGVSQGRNFPRLDRSAKLAFADLLPRARAGRLAGGLPVSERVRVPLVPVRARREPQPREGERTARKQRREDSFPMLFHFLFSFLPLCSNHCTIRTIQV